MVKQVIKLLSKAFNKKQSDDLILHLVPSKHDALSRGQGGRPLCTPRLDSKGNVIAPKPMDRIRLSEEGYTVLDLRLLANGKLLVQWHCTRRLKTVSKSFRSRSFEFAGPLNGKQYTVPEIVAFIKRYVKKRTTNPRFSQWVNSTGTY